MKEDWDAAVFAAGMCLAGMIVMVLWVAYEMWR